VDSILGDSDGDEKVKHGDDGGVAAHGRDANGVHCDCGPMLNLKQQELTSYGHDEALLGDGEMQYGVVMRLSAFTWSRSGRR